MTAWVIRFESFLTVSTILKFRLERWTMYGFISELARKRIWSFYRTWKWLDDSSKVHWYLLSKGVRLCWFRLRSESVSHGPVRMGPIFSKICWPWSGANFSKLLGSGPFRFDFLVGSGPNRFWSMNPWLEQYPLEYSYLTSFDLIWPNSTRSKEYAYQCFCGNRIPLKKLPADQCDLACIGDSNQLRVWNQFLLVHRDIQSESEIWLWNPV